VGESVPQWVTPTGGQTPQRGIAVKRSLLALFATLAVSLGLSGPAWSATANPNASCAGQVGASVAGQPGARAVIAHGFIAEARSEGGAPGLLQSEWSRLHQPLEGCLDFITP
jgi:hypothetical protein